MKRIILTALCSLIYFLGNAAIPAPIKDGCIDLINDHGVITQVVKITYDQSAAGASDIYIWLDMGGGTLLGPLSPTSIIANGNNWDYQYAITQVNIVMKCYDVYEWRDINASDNDVIANGTVKRICPCGTPKIITSCLEEKKKKGGTTQIYKITYDNSANGASDLYLWIDLGGGSYTGPLTPTNITANGSNWDYEYDLSQLQIGIITQCYEVYMYRNTSATFTEVKNHGFKYKICPCSFKPNSVVSGCIDFVKIHGVMSQVIKVTLGGLNGGNPFDLWVDIGGGNIIGPLTPVSITPNGSDWDYLFDVSQAGYNIAMNCYRAYLWGDANATDEEAVSNGAFIRICPCSVPENCDATFSYCRVSGLPNTVTFTPNTTDPDVTQISYDFGDGTSCNNCTIPVQHTYYSQIPQQKTFKVCQRTYYYGRELYCEQCVEICTTLEKLESQSKPSGE